MPIDLPSQSPTNLSPTPGDLPKYARCVIIGGGVAGCSTAYHLAALGWSDIVLLERKQLTSGTTWHAAGLISQGRASPGLQKITMHSADLYERLEAETGISTGFKRNGSLFAVLSEEREREVRRLADSVGMNGLDCGMISAAEAKEKYPYLNVDDVRCGFFIPRDGQCDPANVAQAMAKGARQRGVRIFENTKVTAIRTANGRVTGVATDRGEIAADFVVNAGGMWARDIGQMVGVNVPLHACEHFYIVTEPIAGLPGNLPVLRAPEECAYYKEDAGKILLGCFEPKSKPWGMDGIPEDFCFDQLADDFEHFEPILEMAVKRFPMLETAGIHTFFNGPESFTVDDQWHMGEAPSLKNFYVLAGFNSIGIVSSGGAGWALAQWMQDGEMPFDLTGVDVRRNQPFQKNRTYLRNRVTETLGLLYDDHWPYRQFASARGLRHSPLHERLEGLGACFGETAGWERANWFLPPEARKNGEKPGYVYSWRRQNWFEHARAEHMAVREDAGFFDMSSFGKIRVEGRDAEAVLQRICANDVAVPVGTIVYTQWLNSHAGIVADLTVTRLEENAFLVVTAAANLQRELAWLRNNTPGDAHCIATDVSVQEAVIVVMGPKAREVLQPLTPQSLSNDAFPYAHAREIEIGMGLARAHRVSYVGELGWELYVSTEMARHVFDTIWQAGAPMGLRPCGLHVLDSCRIEKAFRHFGHDISDEDHVLEAGLGFAVKTDKAGSRYGDFIGRSAVLARQQAGLSRRMLQFKLRDPEPLLYHHEPIYRDGKPVGYVTSGNYGHFLGGAIGMGYVKTDVGEKAADILASSYEIVVEGVRVPADASLKPLYDPKAARVRL